MTRGALKGTKRSKVGYIVVCDVAKRSEHSKNHLKWRPREFIAICGVLTTLEPRGMGISEVKGALL